MERLSHQAGRYEYDVRTGQADATLRAQVAQAEATLAQFARLARANGVEAEAVLAALGGRPAKDVEGPQVREWAPAAKA